MTGAFVVKTVVIVMFALGALANVAMVGRDREPVTGVTAAWVVVVNAVLIALILVYWDVPE